MKKIGLLIQMQEVNYLPEKVKQKMQQTLQVLEENYGTERNIEKDLGGYIALIESEQDLTELEALHLDILEESPEWVDQIIVENGQVWIQALFMLSSDFAIVVVGNKEIVDIEE